MGIDPLVTCNAILVCIGIAASAELDVLGVLDAFDFPRKSLTQPGIRLLDLMAVLDALVKHPVLIANAVSHDGQGQRRTTIQKTGRKAPESSIAETGVFLAFVDVLEVEADTVERLGGLVLDAEIEQGVAQQSPHQELQRQIGDAAIVLRLDRIAGLPPSFHKTIARGVYDGLIQKWRISANVAAP